MFGLSGDPAIQPISTTELTYRYAVNDDVGCQARAVTCYVEAQFRPSRLQTPSQGKTSSRPVSE